MTQIIERVARVIDPEAWEELPTSAPDDVVKDRIERLSISKDMAQAALKEIKFDELVGALKKTSACISYMNRDVKGVAEEYLGFWPDDIQDEAYALLSELEKTE